MGILIIIFLLVLVLFACILIKKGDKKEEVSQCTGECSKCGRCH